MLAAGDAVGGSVVGRCGVVLRSSEVLRVCMMTLTRSSGWPTNMPHMPPAVPLSRSLNVDTYSGSIEWSCMVVWAVFT